MRSDYVAIVVVHDHTVSIGPTMTSLLSQEPAPLRVVVVDCGSKDQGWHEQPWTAHPAVKLHVTTNLGFTGGNNLGWQELAPREFATFFLNPDVVLPVGAVARLLRALQAPGDSWGAVGPRLLHYDFAKKELSGRLDSTGIFQSRWGRWYDRRMVPNLEFEVEPVPALCGAAFLARTDSLRACELSEGEVFDRRYFAYKEDIELSLRLTSRGWPVALVHTTEAWHGRGWQSNRRAMPRELRLLSVRNEIRLHARHRRWRVPGSLLKWCAVALLNR